MQKQKIHQTSRFQQALISQESKIQSLQNNNNLNITEYDKLKEFIKQEQNILQDLYNENQQELLYTQ